MSERFGRSARADHMRETGSEGETRGGTPYDNRKQSLYLGEEILSQAKEEAARLDRSLSWVFQKAWKLAHADIQALPSMGEEASASDE
jgi:uncharacterized small protein (TIGR04563 family)